MNLTLRKMVATNVKEEAISLMDARSRVEAEMNAIIDRLCQPGGPGLSGNLVDSEVASFVFFFWVCFPLTPPRDEYWNSGLYSV